VVALLFSIMGLLSKDFVVSGIACVIAVPRLMNAQWFRNTTTELTSGGGVFASAVTGAMLTHC
jgi:hypothetical protein